MEIVAGDVGQASGLYQRSVFNPGERQEAAAPGSGFSKRRHSIAEPGKEESEHGTGGAPHLLDVLGGSGPIRPFLAPLGVDERGRTIWLDICQEGSRHVLVEGEPHSARSEMVRGVAVGLAMTTRPALLQLLAIDFSGRELLVLESLPHAVIDAAAEPAACTESLRWLAAELEARRREGRRWPEMLLVIEDLMSLAGSPCARSRVALTEILRIGGAWGIHVLGGVSSLTSGLRSAGWSSPDVARISADGHPGSFVFRRGASACPLAAIRVPAVDLDRVSRGLRRGTTETHRASEERGPQLPVRARPV